MTEQLPVPKYTDEELDEAKVAITQMTPEMYLEWSAYIQDADDQTRLPEAGCLIFADFVSGDGAEYKLTVRSFSPESTWKKLIRASQIATGYGLKAKTPHTMPQAPVAVIPPAIAAVTALMQAPSNGVPATLLPVPVAPVPVAPTPTAPAQTVDMSDVVSMGVPQGESRGPFRVKEVARTLLKDGTTSYLRAYTDPGTYTAQYGAPIYAELLAMLGIDINAYAIGQKYAPPAVIGWLWIEMKEDGKSVRRCYAVKPQ